MRFAPRQAKHACTLLLTALATLSDDSVAQEDETYIVDSGSSEIHWLVYRDGPLGRLGHNHVIAAGELSGIVTRAADASQSSFELLMPVSSLVVDDPLLRNRYGEDFQSEPNAKNITGTRRNMLGERVLNAANYPEIRVLGEISTGEFESPILSIVVHILGRSIPLSFPSRIVMEGDALIASGEFSVTHADLGMKPFRAALGTLKVREQIDFFYRVRAVKTLASNDAPFTHVLVTATQDGPVYRGEHFDIAGRDENPCPCQIFLPIDSIGLFARGL